MKRERKKLEDILVIKAREALPRIDTAKKEDLNLWYRVPISTPFQTPYKGTPGLTVGRTKVTMITFTFRLCPVYWDGKEETLYWEYVGYECDAQGVDKFLNQEV